MTDILLYGFTNHISFLSSISSVRKTEQASSLSNRWGNWVREVKRYDRDDTAHVNSQWLWSCTHQRSLCTVHLLTRELLITCSRSSWVLINHNFQVGRQVRGKSSLPLQQRCAETNSSPHIGLSQSSLCLHLLLSFVCLIFWLYFSFSSRQVPKLSCCC